jgi:methyl-accepting chemotaxis protein
MAVAIVLSILLSRSFSLPLLRTVESVGEIERKNYARDVSDTERGDEIGDIAKALDRFRGSLSAAEATTVEAAFKGAAFEATGGPMILCDLDQQIVGANNAFVRLLQDNSDDFGVAGRRISKSTLIGQSLKDFSFLPEVITAELRHGGALPIRQKLNIGECYVGLLIDFVFDQTGSPIGFVVDLKNQTFQMASQVLVEAIDGQQARLEMDLDGKIKRFNSHFETLMHASPEKITAMQAQDVVRPEDDVDIWSLARNGTAHVGRFFVTGDGPRRIFDGSFTPVPDQNGQTSGFLLIGTDVTETREQFLKAEAVAKQRAVDLAKVVEKLSVGLRELSSGNLTGTIEDTFAEEYEQLRIDFNEAATQLNAAISEVVLKAASIGDEADGICASVADLSKRTESQAATLEQTAAAMHELTTSVASSAQGAASAAKIANDARENAQASSGVVRATADAMKEIEASSQEVTKIIGVIDDIAFQTNLLALNAGVEAARAGSAGRGFAVVASEVRALAQRCLEASNEISSLISASGQHVERGVSLVGKTARELENIAASVLEISDNVGQIAQASSEQSHGLSEINEALNQLDQATQQNAAMSEETNAAAEALSGEARHLMTVTEKFQTGTRAQDRRVDARVA